MTDKPLAPKHKAPALASLRERPGTVGRAGLGERCGDMPVWRHTTAWAALPAAGVPRGRDEVALVPFLTRLAVHRRAWPCLGHHAHPPAVTTGPGQAFWKEAQGPGVSPRAPTWASARALQGPALILPLLHSSALLTHPWVEGWSPPGTARCGIGRGQHQVREAGQAEGHRRGRATGRL